MDACSPGSVGQLLFPRIESLKFYYWPEFFDVWCEFFKNHQHLQKLHLLLGLTRDFTTQEKPIQLVQLTADLCDLIEIIMHYSKSISVDDVSIFAQNHPKLLKATFIASSVITGKVDVSSFRERLGNEWIVADAYTPPLMGCYPQYELTIERK